MSGLLSYDEALSRLLEDVSATPPESIALGQASGRVLAEDILAERAHPPHAGSAMDGYAVRSKDVTGEKSRLRIIGEAPAGARYGGAVGSGEAVRIFTGAWLPDGADRVVIQENVRRDGDEIMIDAPQTGPANVRRAGLEFDAGTVVLKSGARLGPSDIALAATANRASVLVRKRPRVLIFSTGEELVEPGDDLGPDAIVNSGGFAVAALANKWGADAHLMGILPDIEDVCTDRLRASLDKADIIVTIGGASVGDYDVIKPAFDKLGAERVFEKVAIKPGKPVWHARFKKGPFVIGLPGNPASALVCSWLFLSPFLDAMLGYEGGGARYVEAITDSDIAENGQRETFLRGRAWIDNGVLKVRADTRQDSSLLTPFTRANVLIRRSAGAPAAAAGDNTSVLLIGALSPAFG